MHNPGRNRNELILCIHRKKHHSDSRATTATSGKKASDKEKKLPSNWDRFDSDTEELPTRYASDTVEPKSKGADFAYLISEAKSQLQPNSSAHGFCFADEVINGFNQGPGPLLSVEGERLISWISDYNFPFDDKEISSQEESFFSLNLQSLAEQLSKASLVEKLFIEPDVFPPELLSEYEGKDEKYCNRAEATLKTDATKTDLDGQASNSISNENMNNFVALENNSYISSTSRSMSTQTSINLPVDDISHSGSTVEKLCPDIQTGSVTERPSRFEAIAAESELDMLLDSFNETNFCDSTRVTERSSYTFSKTQASVSVQDWRKGPHSANMGGMNSSLDNSLDDLLKETSNQINSTRAKGALPAKNLEKESDLRNSGSLNTGLEESLNDLLKETSNRTMPTSTKEPVQEVNVVTSRTETSTTQSSLKSKILDDFDSWFDSM